MDEEEEETEKKEGTKMRIGLHVCKTRVDGEVQAKDEREEMDEKRKEATREEQLESGWIQRKALRAGSEQGRKTKDERTEAT